MKSASISTRAVLWAALLAAAVGGAAPAMGMASPGQVVVPAQDVTALTQAIAQAPDPSAAIQAYARATAAAPSDVNVEIAYLHRMVSFGLPEMADTQAADITQRDPTDGEAWAVAAYMIAKKSQGGAGTAWGLMDADLAVIASPNDPFVARTAGQLVAWYDVQADKTQIAGAAQKAVDDIRQKLAGNADYADAYARASADYLKMAASAASQPATGATEAAPPATGAAAVVPPAATVLAAPVPYYSDVIYAPYPEPYIVSPYDYYWYPSLCIGTGWWFPSYFGTIIIGDNFHHRDFDHDRDDRDRDFDRGRIGDGDRVARGGDFGGGRSGDLGRVGSGGGFDGGRRIESPRPLGGTTTSGSRGTASSGGVTRLSAEGSRVSLRSEPSTTSIFPERSARPSVVSSRSLTETPRGATARIEPPISSFSEPARVSGSPRSNARRIEAPISSFSEPSRVTASPPVYAAPSEPRMTFSEPSRVSASPRVSSAPSEPRITFSEPPRVSASPRVYTAPSAPRISTFSEPSRTLMSAGPRLSAPSLGGSPGIRSAGGGGGVRISGGSSGGGSRGGGGGFTRGGGGGGRGRR